MFDMIFSDIKGRFYNHPELGMVGRLGDAFVEPEESEMIPLPDGSTLVFLQDRVPMGVDSSNNFIIARDEKKQMFPVGALLPQGYTRTLLPAYQKEGEAMLPLFGYAAVGWKDGQVFVAAHPTDDEAFKWSPVNYNKAELGLLVEAKLVKYEGNRILRQLAKCALEYCCFTAQNIFYGRWEGGIPVSPSCNARCLGCISEQPAECCPSPQSRIDFVPNAEEIEQIALEHLQLAEGGIISFGQGCEGEPALSWQVVGQAIRGLREKTPLGTINMNTNGGYTSGVRAICDAGIDSLRVSTISALEKTYNAYYRPHNYKFEDVKNSIIYAKDKGVFVALNLLTYPGLTDREEELEALIEMIDDLGIDMVQFRNLNIDPEHFSASVGVGVQSIGVPGLIECLAGEFPDLIIGSFSRPLR